MSFSDEQSSDRQDESNRFDRQYEDEKERVMTERSDEDERDRFDIREAQDRSLQTKTTEKSDVINLGKAGGFVMLAKANINNESESSISGQTGAGEGTKSDYEKDDSDVEGQRTTEHDAVWQRDRSDKTSTDVDASSDVNEAIEDMMTAYNSVSSQNHERAQHREDRGFDYDQDRDQDRRQDRDQDRQQDGDDATTHQDDHIPDMDLKPGVHQWSNALNVHPDFTLSGSEEDVWIFKVGGDLTVDEDFVLTLSDGAQAENIFWYVEGEVTIGKDAQFEGIILSMNDITLEKGAKLNGRMFSQASINLDDNTVNEPSSMAGRTTSRNR